MGDIADLIFSFAIGPYYLDKNTPSIIDPDAAYWLLVTDY
jgi:hypothetical protein